MANTNQFLMLASMLVVSCWSGVSVAFSSGAPAFVCDSMMPGHGVAALAGDGGCNLRFAGHISEGNKQQLTLECGGREFSGYFIQCRSGSDTGEAVGQFTAPAGSTTRSCSGRTDSGVSHSSGARKTSVTLDWQADSTACASTVQCRATVVFSFPVYTTQVRATPAMCTEPTTPPPSCPQNQVFSTCGSACPDTCDGSLNLCADVCLTGCFCAEGFVKHEGQCIQRSACPVEVTTMPAEPTEETTMPAEPTEETTMAAEPTEETTMAAEPTEETTMAAEPTEETTMAAEPTEQTTETEIKTETTTANLRCPTNEVFRDVIAACPETCDGGQRGVFALCVPGCYCAGGLVRHGGECIDRSACPPPPQEAEEEQMEWNGECPAQRECGHFDEIGGVEGQCCPSCNKNISQCAGTQCPAIVGCRRYEKRVRSGECCLRCRRYRRTDNIIPGAVCANVICAKGMTCTNSEGRATCTCKSCPNVTDPSAQVTGKDGNTYASVCHRLRQACMTCMDV
ncbi:zonadhesin-like isoform X1 [Sycon ciliatum]|uniref:zonadhesin-like isoform X1 n=1 Tax=Sycon ciliatum TaxID=27933 RepID=UPI0031F6E7AE